MGIADDALRSKGDSYCIKRHTKRELMPPRGLILEYLVSRWLYFWRLFSALWAWVGNSLKMDAIKCSPAQRRMSICYLPHWARNECECEKLVPHSWSSVWIPRDSWLVYFNCWLLYSQGQWRLSDLSSNLPLCLSPLPRCSNFLSRSYRQWRDPHQMEDHWEGNRFWNGWARSTTLWPRKKCLLVWFSARNSPSS